MGSKSWWFRRKLLDLLSHGLWTFASKTQKVCEDRFSVFFDARDLDLHVKDGRRWGFCAEAGQYWFRVRAASWGQAMGKVRADAKAVWLILTFPRDSTSCKFMRYKPCGRSDNYRERPTPIYREHGKVKRSFDRCSCFSRKSIYLICRQGFLFPVVQANCFCCRRSRLRIAGTVCLTYVSI